MRYYSESDMEDLRTKLEAEVLAWPKTAARRMFGCPSYQAAGKLFAFLVTDGLVLTHLPPKDQERLARLRGAGPFRAGTRTVQRWVKVSAKERRDLERLLPFIRRSYEAALEEG